MLYTKRFLGYLWMLLGPAAMVFMIWQAIDKVGLAWAPVKAATSEIARQNAHSIFINTILQWGIIILVFLPIAMGMVIFGRYAANGEYDNLPTSSAELEADTI